jgi:DNA-binding NarL/FixJ family response regulator
VPNKKNKNKARILLVDDHPALREALATRIGRQPDLEVCGEAGDLPEALTKVDELRPDLAVVDITLKSGNGIELIKRIKDRDTPVSILVCSMHNESLYAERALRAGALGYINKDQATDKIVEAIRRVLDGKVYLSDGAVESVLHRTVGGDRKHIARLPLDLLADRELEVFRFIGEGVKTAEIARRMHLSVKTIETYRDRIRQKLDLKDGTELAHFATKWMLQEE